MAVSIVQEEKKSVEALWSYGHAKESEWMLFCVPKDHFPGNFV